MRAVIRCLVPVALVATGACALRGDVVALQNNLQSMQTASAHADSARAAQLARIIADLGTVRDSLRILSSRMIKSQGDVREDLYGIGQQLIQVQALTGQSQQRLQELRSSLEQRNPGPVPAPAGPGGDSTGSAPAGAARGATGAPGATAAPGTPGPNQLFQLSVQQLRQGSPGAAQVGFQTLLRQYPSADVAPDAEFYLGEAYRAQGNEAAADSAYATVVQRFPKSARAPTALYKQALSLEQAGNTASARAMLQRLIRSYPQSDEAALARDRLRAMK